MTDGKTFDTLVLVTLQTYERLRGNYEKLLDFLPGGKLIFLGPKEVAEAVEADAWGPRVRALFEDEVLPFSSVHACMEEKMTPLLHGEALPRGITAWYYQQFLKMNYAKNCRDEYYLVWDGDTIPCRPVRMFREGTDTAYLDMKHETHAEYFVTLENILPGTKKVLERSFISEHMLMKTEIMQEIIRAIEENEALSGGAFYERILRAIPAEKITDSAFSEYETYGSYVALHHPKEYLLRDWHSFRLGGEFFEPALMTERDYTWLGQDFDAISFEKAHHVREDHRGLFDNPQYQAKLSAKQMLQIAQEEFGEEGYREVWTDDGTMDVNVTTGAFGNGENE